MTRGNFYDSLIMTHAKRMPLYQTEISACLRLISVKKVTCNKLVRFFFDVFGRKNVETNQYTGQGCLTSTWGFVG